MTIKQVFKLNIDYSSSPYVFYTDGNYPINGTAYEGTFIYTTLTDYPQLAVISPGDDEIINL